MRIFFFIKRNFNILRKGLTVLFLLALTANTYAEDFYDGSARVGGRSVLPFRGFYAASNSFAKNSVVLVRNLENNTATKVLVVDNRLPDDQKQFLLLLSQEAGEALGIEGGNTAQVRVTIEALDQTDAYSLGVEPVQHPDPEIGSSPSYAPPSVPAQNVTEKPEPKSSPTDYTEPEAVSSPHPITRPNNSALLAQGTLPRPKAAPAGHPEAAPAEATALMPETQVPDNSVLLEKRAAESKIPEPSSSYIEPVSGISDTPEKIRQSDPRVSQPIASAPEVKAPRQIVGNETSSLPSPQTLSESDSKDLPIPNSLGQPLPTTQIKDSISPPPAPTPSSAPALAPVPASAPASNLTTAPVAESPPTTAPLSGQGTAESFSSPLPIPSVAGITPELFAPRSAGGGNLDGLLKDFYQAPEISGVSETQTVADPVLPLATARPSLPLAEPSIAAEPEATPFVPANVTGISPSYERPAQNQSGMTLEAPPSYVKNETPGRIPAPAVSVPEISASPSPLVSESMSLPGPTPESRSTLKPPPSLVTIAPPITAPKPATRPAPIKAAPESSAIFNPGASTTRVVPVNPAPASLSSPPPTKPAERTENPAFYLQKAELRPPGEVGPRPDPESGDPAGALPEFLTEPRPGLSSAKAATAQQNPSFAGSGTARLIGSLESGSAYIQVGAFRSEEAAQAVAGTFASSYQSYIYNRDGRADTYRLLLGPFTESEIGLKILDVKNLGYNEAFIRRSR